MKRFTLFVFLVAMVTSPMMAERVTPETARKVATTFLTNNGAKSAQLTDLTKSAGFANLYIFTAERGFVVMAADDRVQPILGYSLTNAFVAEGMPENISGWLQGYSDEIQDVIDLNLSGDRSAQQEWQDLKDGKASRNVADVVVGPLITTLWDQVEPYNDLCPSDAGGPGGHALTGCVATAMAQVMKYWNYPTTGKDSHTYTHSTYGEQTANFGSTTYDWANMTNTYGGSSTDTQKLAVATLMYHCGVSVEMNYGPSGSGANSSNVSDAMVNYFRYSPSATMVYRSSYTDAQWIAFLKHELDERRPLYYSGSNVGSGHAFVCDGYRSDDYFHFNWGWSGYDGAYGEAHGNNGYWAIGELSPGSGGSGSGSGTYNLNNAVIAWVEPDYSNDLTAPTLSAVAAEGTATLNWNAISGAVSYTVYKDNGIIAEGLTETTYSDNNISFGTDIEYFVRAIGSGETKSNPSNRVIVKSLYRNISPSNLSSTYSSGTVSINWTGYSGGLSTDLHYGLDYYGYVYGSGENDTYWGQKYPASMLEYLYGMEIVKVSSYFYYAGTYELYLINGNINADPLYHTSYTKPSNGFMWVDFVTSQHIDVSKDLWVVFYLSSDSPINPAASALYSDTGAENASYLSSTLNTLPENPNMGLSWLIRTYLTDGTYTYHLYDNGVSVADDIATTNYTVTSLASNTTHQYTVKTNYYGGETAASNMAGITLGTASIANLALGTNDKMTVTEGGKLTVTGTLSNSGTATNLVVESGGQLVTSNAVAATVKKDITGYNGGTGKWYLIASPVNSNLAASSVDNLIDGTYDLYRLDQSKTSNEWCNYKANTFTIDNQKGYLYANNANVTLEFSGSMKPSNANVAVDLAYTSGNRIAGYNLVGNPFPCNAYANKAYYAMNAAGTNFEAKTTNDAIAPCTGVVVCATGTGQSVTFSKTAPDASISKGCLQIALAQANEKDGVSTLSTGSGSSSTTDNAIVSFNEGEELGKFVFNDEKAKIYLTQNGKDYAIATSDGTGVMPLNFKATEDGIYSLTVNPEGTELSYLHLIDKLTGNDIDLLATPSYTFEAKSNDSAKRFRLVFGGSSTGSEAAESFAYFDGSEWVIENNGEATLQVVDVMGRVLRSETVNGDATADINNLSAGVYVLRLVNGEQVKTQKIVIE